MKRILIVNYEFPPLGGGGGVATYELARELSKKYEVHCITSGVEGLAAYEIVDGIHIHRTMIRGRKNRSTATISSMLHYVLGFNKVAVPLCKANKFDYVWTWFAIPSGIPGMRIAKKFNIPHTLTIVGGDIYDPSKRMSPHRHPLLRMIVSRLINNSDRVTAISNDVKEQALTYYRVDKEINVLPLGFTPKSFSKASRQELGMADDAFYFIATGRLVKRKGFSYLIEALSLMKNTKARLIIIGDGPLETMLKEMAGNLDVSERIIFADYVKEEKKFQYLAASDCYVLSSLHEGFGIVLQEAMYCGLPIISTNRGGQTDFLEAGVNASFVPVGNSRKLSEAMEAIVEDNDFRETLGNNNLQKVKDYYAESVVKLYEKILLSSAR